MATKTLLKDITIRDKKGAVEFCRAVEKINRNRASATPVKFNREVRTLTKEQIFKVFGTK